MKVKKIIGVVNGVRKKAFSKTIEYEILPERIRTSIYIETVADKPEFSIGDVLEISIRKSYMGVRKC